MLTDKEKKAFEDRITILEESLEKMRREYNDLMYNLEEENFTPEFLNKIMNNTRTTTE
jgi:hypothetical protein